MIDLRCQVYFEYVLYTSHHFSTTPTEDKRFQIKEHTRNPARESRFQLGYLLVDSPRYFLQIWVLEHQIGLI